MTGLTSTNACCTGGSDSQLGERLGLENVDEPFLAKFEDGQKRNDDPLSSFFSEEKLRKKETIRSFKVFQNG